MGRTAANAISKKLPVYGLTTLSLFIVSYLAYRSSSERPPTAGEATWLAVLAGIFQLLAAAIGARDGRADPNFVKSAVMRLGKIALKAHMAELLAQRTFEQEMIDSRRVPLGQLSVTLSFLQEEVADAIKDWDNLYPEVLMKMAEQSMDHPAVLAKPQEESHA